MFCSTECWDCEDKKCERYVSKRDLFFKYAEQNRKLDIIKKNLKEIVITGYDFDGFNDVDNLKKMIEGFVKIADETIELIEGEDKNEI